MNQEPEDFEPGVIHWSLSESTVPLDTVDKPKERQLTDKQIDEALDLRILAERIAGFGASLDGVKDIRIANSREASKLTKKPYDSWEHVGSLPMEVITALYQFYTPEELTADGGKLLLKYIQRNKELKVTDANL